MSTATPSSRWRSRAKDFRDHAQEPLARAYEICATELEEWLREQDERPVDLQEAATLSGYSGDHLGRLVREGKIPNAGRQGAPRIALRDVPIKPRASVPGVAEDATVGDSSFEQIVQSIIDEGEG